MNGPVLTVFTWSEDAAEEAHQVIVALAKRMFILIDGSCQSHRIAFDGLRFEDAKRLTGSLWKSTKPSDRRSLVGFRRAVADALVREDTFLLVHIDGDEPWSNRADSRTPANLDKHLRAPVAQLLASKGKDVAACLSRLIVLVPYYSIEAWLFQHTSEARKVCKGHAAHEKLLSEWESDRTLLDELTGPKHALPCWREHTDRYPALAGAGFPAPQVYAAAMSYAATVNALKACPALVTAIERTWNPEAG